MADKLPAKAGCCVANPYRLQMGPLMLLISDGLGNDRHVLPTVQMLQFCWKDGWQCCSGRSMDRVAAQLH